MIKHLKPHSRLKILYHLTKDRIEDRIKYLFKRELKQYKLKGVFMYYDKENKNGRIYSREIVDNIVEDFNNNNMFYGEFGHSERFEVALQNVSHRVTNLWIDEKKKSLNGKIEILNTPKGNLLLELVKNKVKMAIGSRGSGTVDLETKQIKNYKFYSFDVIPASQATSNEYLKRTK